jgi:REP element-mobilizing transposase RayT
MNAPVYWNYFITWTTYGTWLPGDSRGWKKTGHGEQPPQPRLEEWCRQRLNADPVILSPIQRKKVDQSCRDHVVYRGWKLHAINVRSNHVHVLVMADISRFRVRDQLKAYATRPLRKHPERITSPKIWSRGGDCRIIDDEDGLKQVIDYINNRQD